MAKQEQLKDEQQKAFFGDGFFEWQFSGKDYHEKLYAEAQYNPDKYWGGFSREPFDEAGYKLPDWAIGPFAKYGRNPVFAPSRVKGAWDRGRLGGGVHNGSVIRKDGLFYYIYRGHQELPDDYWGGGVNPKIDDYWVIDYICDIGVALSTDGVHFERALLHSPLFRRGKDEKYSYEDVCVVKHEDTYYLFCNQWNWKHRLDPRENGCFIATSKDLLNWEKRGIAFPGANRIHRNPCVLQNPDNEAVRLADGKFVMYLNDGIIAYSDDLLHWESKTIKDLWPGGEGCVAVTGYSAEHPDNIVLFTGGHHTGHFYAIGEVLFDRSNPEQPLEWLPRPIIHAEERYPHENCRSVEDPHKLVSYYRDTIFFTGLTRHNGEWRMYYGGSEFYTCLATAKA